MLERYICEVEVYSFEQHVVGDEHIGIGIAHHCGVVAGAKQRACVYQWKPLVIRSIKPNSPILDISVSFGPYGRLV